MQKRIIALAVGFLSIPGITVAAPMPVQDYVGRGVQVFRCDANGAAPSWQLLGPDAHLYDADGRIMARHFFGPSWQANDGSKITGEVLVANASPAGADNAPWLLLRVVSSQGAGLFAQAKMVTRTDTRGGGAPSQACTAANKGATMRVPYSARYVLFSQ